MMKESTVSESTSNPENTISPEDAERIKENFTKLLTPFKMSVSHRDDDGNDGETSLTLKSETILGAISCLERFESFRELGWKTVLVQELYDPAEQEDGDLINSAEIDRRLTARLAEETPKTFREGALSFNFAYTHPLLKGEQSSTLRIEYRYNQVLHLIQMINTVLTDKFSSELIAGLKKDLDADRNTGKHHIKL